VHSHAMETRKEEHIGGGRDLDKEKASQMFLIDYIVDIQSFVYIYMMGGLFPW